MTKYYVDSRTLGCKIGKVIFSDCFTCPLPKCRYEMTPIELSRNLKDLDRMGLLVTEFSSKDKIVLRR